MQINSLNFYLRLAPYSKALSISEIVILSNTNLFLCSLDFKLARLFSARSMQGW